MTLLHAAGIAVVEGREAARIDRMRCLVQEHIVQMRRIGEQQPHVDDDHALVLGQAGGARPAQVLVGGVPGLVLCELRDHGPEFVGGGDMVADVLGREHQVGQPDAADQFRLGVRAQARLLADAGDHVRLDPAVVRQGDALEHHGFDGLRELGDRGLGLLGLAGVGESHAVDGGIDVLLPAQSREAVLLDDGLELRPQLRHDGPEPRLPALFAGVLERPAADHLVCQDRSGRGCCQRGRPQAAGLLDQRTGGRHRVLEPGLRMRKGR